MVLSKPHNRAVDLWALGIFLFELITRTTPFDHPTTVRAECNLYIPSQTIFLIPLFEIY